jgi:hypothetical protein
MKTEILRIVTRLFGLVELALGIVFWAGSAKVLVISHIALGVIMTAALFGLTYQAYRAGAARRLVLLAAAVGLALPAWGMAQHSILPGAYHWIAEVLHLLLGAGAIGAAEIMAVQVRRGSARPDRAREAARLQLA